MLDLVIEVDGRPLSRWGCDGVVFATPTGSTAYAFSAGGPVVWPEVEALLLVPISAHALFARPMVVSPRSVLAAEVIGATPGPRRDFSRRVLWCDGRRRVELDPGARVEVRRGSEPVLLARLRGAGAVGEGAEIGAPFTDRLVAKFGLPVAGWRGQGDRRQAEHGGMAGRQGRRQRAREPRQRASETRSRAAMLEEVRISGLGVIDDAVLELSPGFNVVTGETGAGKTMVVSGLGLLFGGRADPARVRPGADRANVEGRLSVEADGPVARQVNDAGGDLDDEGGTLILSRSVSAEGRSRAYAGGRSVPVSLLTYLADDLVAVHGQADQQQLLKPGRQREALDRFAGPASPRCWPSYQRAYQRHRDVRAELDELTSQARERQREAEDLRRGLAEIEQADPADGEDVELLAEEQRLSHADALHAAATTAHEALLGDPSSGQYDAADAVTLLGLARQALEGAAQHDAALAALGARVSEAAYLVSDVAADLASYAQSVEADPARLAAVQERRATLEPPDPDVRRPGRRTGRYSRPRRGPGAGEATGTGGRRPPPRRTSRRLSRPAARRRGAGAAAAPRPAPSRPCSPGPSRPAPGSPS